MKIVGVVLLVFIFATLSELLVLSLMNQLQLEEIERKLAMLPTGIILGKQEK